MNGLLPDDTFEFVLPGDTDQPPQAQRVMVYRHGRAMKWLTWSRRAAEISGMREWDKRLEAYADLIRTDLVSVRNLDAANLLDGLLQSELAVIAENLPSVAMLSEFDRKKSHSPSPSDTAPSAASAAAPTGA